MYIVLCEIINRALSVQSHTSVKTKNYNKILKFSPVNFSTHSASFWFSCLPPTHSSHPHACLSLFTYFQPPPFLHNYPLRKTIYEAQDWVTPNKPGVGFHSCIIGPPDVRLVELQVEVCLYNSFNRSSVRGLRPFLFARIADSGIQKNVMFEKIKYKSFYNIN